ncbi:MAG: zinc ribbon domain-containing protein [Halobacteriaceae archaeon]
MSKITFRANDELIEEVESLDKSKSEIMRQALRMYLGKESTEDDTQQPTIDDIIADRIDAMLGERIRQHNSGETKDVNVNINVDPNSETTQPDQHSQRSSTHEVPHDTESSSQSIECQQCGEAVSPDHVYCPNCGEKVANRIFCECGDELRSDWAYCPSCGRRTPSADVLDR